LGISCAIIDEFPLPRGWIYKKTKEEMFP
jgi:hypothetical protein